MSDKEEGQDVTYDDNGIPMDPEIYSGETLAFFNNEEGAGSIEDFTEVSPGLSSMPEEVSAMVDDADEQPSSPDKEEQGGEEEKDSDEHNSIYLEIRGEKFSEDDEISIPGLDAPVSVKDIVDRHRGETDIRQRYGVLGNKEDIVRKKETEIEAREAKIKRGLETLANTLDALGGENKKEGLEKFLIDGGINHVKWKHELFQEMVEDFAAWQEMSDSEREAAELRGENALYKAKESTISKEDQNRQAVEQIRTETERVLKTKGVAYLGGPELTIKDVDIAAEKIETFLKDRSLVPEGHPLNDFLDEYPKKDPRGQLDAVIDYLDWESKANYVVQMLDKVDKDLKNNEDIFKDLYSQVLNPYGKRRSEEEWVQHIRDTYSDALANASADGVKLLDEEDKAQKKSKEKKALDEKPLSAMDLMGPLGTMGR